MSTATPALNGTGWVYNSVASTYTINRGAFVKIIGSTDNKKVILSGNGNFTNSIDVVLAGASIDMSASPLTVTPGGMLCVI